jgi:cytosine/adenosine deaminase-related metal-dependent hydrolase
LQEILNTSSVLHRCPWIVADAALQATGDERGVIENGAVLAVDGAIQAVGKYNDLAAEFGSAVIVDHDYVVLTPGLINGHAHLELSHLAVQHPAEIRSFQDGDMPGWIRCLLNSMQEFSEKNNHAAEKIIDYGRQALNYMFETGVAFVGDIGNHRESRNISKNYPDRVSFLLELLGLTREAENLGLALLSAADKESSIDIGFAAHAPYSTTKKLIHEIKELSRKHENVFSIHVAESAAEIEFLWSGKGNFRQFLEDRGVWDNRFQPPGTGAVNYLDRLGVLDDKTLCVHVVHIDQQEVEILATKKAKVCLCPGSNRYLGVGKPPVAKLLSKGILPALGTDSLASNISVNMWREMQLLREDSPAIDPCLVFGMATRGGAEAWQIDSLLGTLAPGKKAMFLAIESQASLKSVTEVMDYLTSLGETARVNWIE